MRTVTARNFKATIAAAALLGALAGVWSSGPSTASTAASAAAKPSGYCGSVACESITWLRMPALRAR